MAILIEWEKYRLPDGKESLVINSLASLMGNIRKKLKTTLMEALIIVPISLLLAYVLLGGFALFFSNGLIFPAPASSYSDNSQILKIPLSNGKVFSALYMPNPNAKYLLLYSHGNAEDLGHILQHLKEFHQFGFSVFAYDYPGYGTSEGSPNEKIIYETIDAAYDFVTDDLSVPTESIIGYGRSLGGGPTAYLAAREKLGGIILESTFLTAFRVMTKIPLLPWDKFRNIRNANDFSSPLLVIHGTEDEMIPFWHGETLFDEAPQPKSYFWVESAGHNNLMDYAGSTYWDTLKAFMNTVENFNSEM